MMAEKNKIAVLIASYKGKQWIGEQIDSILSQRSVEVTLFISVDKSDDGTEEFVKQSALADPRINVLSCGHRYGQAGANFYRLILEVDLSRFDYVAFADQDDIWATDKLSSQASLIESHNAEAVSSNVIAFWPDGSTKLIKKSQPQKAFDFLFESAGQGCTYLMGPWLIGQIKSYLEENPMARKVEMHDWLAYAVCRAHGKLWLIDDFPLVQYRQHPSNAFGVNVGWKAIMARIKRIRSGWYRDQVGMISSVVSAASGDHRLIAFDEIIHRRTFLNQLRLIRYAAEGRRKFRERMFLILMISLFIF